MAIGHLSRSTHERNQKCVEYLFATRGLQACIAHRPTGGGVLIRPKRSVVTSVELRKLLEADPIASPEGRGRISVLAVDVPAL